jgi:hypothetical protein
MSIWEMYAEMLLMYDPKETQAMVERGELCVCGIDEHCPKCAKFEVTKVDHEARTVEMRKVGCTDICGKCGLSDCDHLAHSQGFFLHLPDTRGAEIKADIPVTFNEPWRSVLITSILTEPPVPQQTYACAKCGELHCTRNHPEFT